MFGEMLFSTIPFSTYNTDGNIEPYEQKWVNVCLEDTDWDNEEANIIQTKECTNGS
jgi:hypothetical protein